MAETPAGTTEHYGIPLWGPDNLADVEATVNVTAEEADAALHLAVARIDATERHYALMLMGA